MPPPDWPSTSRRANSSCASASLRLHRLRLLHHSHDVDHIALLHRLEIVVAGANRHRRPRRRRPASARSAASVGRRARRRSCAPGKRSRILRTRGCVGDAAQPLGLRAPPRFRAASGAVAPGGERHHPALAGPFARAGATAPGRSRATRPRPARTRSAPARSARAGRRSSSAWQSWMSRLARASATTSSKRARRGAVDGAAIGAGAGAAERARAQRRAARSTAASARRRAGRGGARRREARRRFARSPPACATRLPASADRRRRRDGSAPFRPRRAAAANP